MRLPALRGGEREGSCRKRHKQPRRQSNEDAEETGSLFSHRARSEQSKQQRNQDRDAEQGYQSVEVNRKQGRANETFMSAVLASHHDGMTAPPNDVDPFLICQGAADLILAILHPSDNVGGHFRDDIALVTTWHEQSYRLQISFE